MILAIIPVAAFFVLNNKLFNRSENDSVPVTRRTVIVAVFAALIIGMYDGMYGPGTGTFLIIAFTVFARLSVESSNAQAKIINLTSNITALIVFLLHHQGTAKIVVRLRILLVLFQRFPVKYLGFGIVLHVKEAVSLANQLAIGLC
jgi:uncharacterized membrane protein YfcA